MGGAGGGAFVNNNNNPVFFFRIYPWWLSCLCCDGRRGLKAVPTHPTQPILLSITVSQPTPSPPLFAPPSQEANIALVQREGGGGSSWQWNTWNTWLKLCVALFNAAHSLYSLNRCFWKLDPVFSECLQNVNPPSPQPPSPKMPVVGWLIFSFRLPPSHCLTLHGPRPWPPSGFGGVKCTINAIFMDSILFFFFF